LECIVLLVLELAVPFVGAVCLLPSDEVESFIIDPDLLLLFLTLLSVNEVMLRLLASLLTIARCCFDEGVLKIDVKSDFIFVSFFFFFFFVAVEFYVLFVLGLLNFFLRTYGLLGCLAVKLYILYIIYISIDYFNCFYHYWLRQ
jgi:hypothetical protein